MTPKKEKELITLRKKWKNCENCDLCEIRNRPVFGRGLCKKRIVIMGEAPGPDEDREGNPFIGRAGNMLDKMLGFAILERNDTFIFNVLQCYPGRNDAGGFNKPTELQVIRCSQRWHEVLHILKPKLIIVLGDSALFALTDQHGIGKNRGFKDAIFAEDQKYLIYVTYHPSAVNRSPMFKENAKEDWKEIRRFVHGKGRPKRKREKKKSPNRLL